MYVCMYACTRLRRAILQGINFIASALVYKLSFVNNLHTQVCGHSKKSYQHA